MNPSNLSVQQLQVIDALSSGVSLTEAAAKPAFTATQSPTGSAISRNSNKLCRKLNPAASSSSANEPKIWPASPSIPSEKS